MAYSGHLPHHQRGLALAATLLVAALVGVVLLHGLGVDTVRRMGEAIAAVSLPAPPPPPQPEPPTRTADKPAGAASAANLPAKAAPVLALPPVIPPRIPPVAAAPDPGSGSDASAGAAPVAGPGSGAGGRGDGTGAGGAGSGTGGGTRPVWRSGRIDDDDYPRSASRAKVGGEVEVRFTIRPDGRVTACRTSKSSGDAALDATTCRLIEARFRFQPATDGAGRAIASSYGWRQTWWLERKR